MTTFLEGLRCRECGAATAAEARSACDECFGPLETAAQDLIARSAAENGLQVEHDRVRNLVVTLPGREVAAPFVAELLGVASATDPQVGYYSSWIA